MLTVLLCCTRFIHIILRECDGCNHEESGLDVTRPVQIRYNIPCYLRHDKILRD